METKWGNLWYTCVSEPYLDLATAWEAADVLELLYDLSCVVDKVKTKWYIFARGPTYHLVVDGKPGSIRGGKK